MGGDNAIETVGKWIMAESLGSQPPEETITGGKRSRAAFRGANLVPERSLGSFFSTCTTNRERLLNQTGSGGRVYQLDRYSRPTFLL